MTKASCASDGSATRPARTPIPKSPALVPRGVMGALGIGLSAVACGGKTESVPPTVDAPTTTPTPDAARDAGVDSGHDAVADTGRDAPVDSGYVLGLYDASGRDAAHVIGDAASDGYILEPPCGKRALPHPHP